MILVPLVRRRRRLSRHRAWRRGGSAALGLLCACLSAATALAFPLAGSSQASSAPRPEIKSVKFPWSFVPERVVAQAGSVWVLGSSGAASCSLDEVDPVTLRLHAYRVPLCAYYLTTGDGLVYLAGDDSDGNNDVFHLEVFNPTTKHATVMGPEMLTTQGSTRAHLDMAYGDGSVWMSDYSGILVQVSPTTGAVLDRITNAPQSVGGHGTIVVSSGGLWLVAGASDPGSLYRLAEGSASLTSVYTDPPNTFISWLASIGGTVWAAVQNGHPGHGPVSTNLIAFDGASGQQIVTGPSETYGDVPLVGSGDDLWSVGTGGLCAAPQKLWRIDAATGKSTAVATLSTPIEPCLTEDPNTSMLAVDGASVFVLEPTGSASPAGVLYRVQPPKVSLHTGR